MPGLQRTIQTASRNLALRTTTLVASAEAEDILGRTKLSKFYGLKDDVWISTHRLEEKLLEAKELDFIPFFEAVSIKVLPVLAAHTQLFYSLLNKIHFRELPHPGVEATLACIRQSYLVGDPRRVITMVKKSCSKCRLKNGAC